MKTIRFLIFILFSILTISCFDDDQETEPSIYPITLRLNGTGFNDYIYYRNGVKTEVTKDVLESYQGTEDAIDTLSLFEAYEGDYFKFITDSDIEFLEGETITRAKYMLKDGYIFLEDEDFENQYYVLAKGSLEKGLELRMYSIRFNDTDDNTDDTFGNEGEFNLFFEDEVDTEDFPASFENTQYLHDFEFIEDITDDKFLFIHNSSLLFSPEK